MRNVVLAAVLLVGVACGAYRFPGDSPSPSSQSAHVSGTVVSVPCAPVEQADSVCKGRPVPGLELDYMSGTTVVAKAVTAEGGTYAIDLQPGTYSVQLKTSMRLISGPTNLTLGAGTSTVASYVLDNGIRQPLPQQ